MVRPAFPPRPPGPAGILPPLSRPPIHGFRGPILPPIVRPAVIPIVTPIEKPQTIVYVGKIASTVENDFMTSLLQLCGPVKSWKRAQDPSNGTLKGFGFCEFDSAEGVLRALRLLSKVNIDGQELMLRNLLSATSKHDVYLMQNYAVMHWSSLMRRGKEVLNVAKAIVPNSKYPGSLAQPLSRVQISTMAVKDNLMVAGGFQGELICKNLDEPGVAFCTKITTEENAITNAVDICHEPNGSPRIMTANNDAQVRVFDTLNFTCLNRFTFPWSVNNSSVSPDGKLLAVLGDSAECLIADAQSGKVLNNLKGHLDYSFASAWHPDGQLLATGNQDTTCRLWDIRNLSESVAILKGRMGAIRAIRFTSDGRFMAMAEPADFIHIFDAKSDYAVGQEIDLFGEIAGICFSPDTEALFVGVADRTYGSLLEFNRRRYNQYLESMF